MKKRITQVDSDTGEVIGDFVAVIQPKRRNAFNRGWVAMSQDPLNILARDLKRAEDYRVLFALLARLDWDNMLLLNQTEIANHLGIDKAHVSRSIRRLTDMGVVIKGEKIGVHQSYRLNAGYGWKGSAASHRKESHGFAVIDGGKSSS